MTATAEGLELERLTVANVHEVLPLRDACADDLTAKHGYGHWSTHGTLRTLRRHAEQKHVYAARLAGQPVATMTLSLKKPPFHRVAWYTDPEARAAYLTGLYVRPDAQRRGIGRWMMAEAERIARDWGCLSIRFDAYTGPAGATAFYRSLGYASRGEVEVNGVGLEVFERAV